MKDPTQANWPGLYEQNSLPVPDQDLIEQLRNPGFRFVHGARMRALLGQMASGKLSDWPVFAQSWETLEIDTYMADQGRYRRRRHAVYRASPTDGIIRAPHRPHFQAVDHNALYGGIERSFEPIASDIGAGDTMRAVLAFCHATFGALRPDVRAWDIEVHQFRIEARPGAPGEPTPEGVHRDGVDYVLVLMVSRFNISRGTTQICTVDQKVLSSFTLAQPLDATLLDDQRVYHGVTAVEPIDPQRPAWRDVLVVTFKVAC